jgi:hypothetical protein
MRVGKYFGGNIKEDGMGEAYGTNGVEEKFLVGRR